MSATIEDFRNVDSLLRYLTEHADSSLDFGPTTPFFKVSGCPQYKHFSLNPNTSGSFGVEDLVIPEIYNIEPFGIIIKTLWAAIGDGGYHYLKDNKVNSLDSLYDDNVGQPICFENAIDVNKFFSSSLCRVVDKIRDKTLYADTLIYGYSRHHDFFDLFVPCHDLVLGFADIANISFFPSLEGMHVMLNCSSIELIAGLPKVYIFLQMLLFLVYMYTRIPILEYTICANNSYLDMGNVRKLQKIIATGIQKKTANIPDRPSIFYKHHVAINNYSFKEFVQSIRPRSIELFNYFPDSGRI